MPHQGDAAALRGAAEKCNLRAVLLERISVYHGRRVCVGVHTISIAWLVYNHSRAIAVDSNLIAANDLQARLVGLAEVPACVRAEPYETIGTFVLTLELSLPLHLLLHPLSYTWVYLEYQYCAFLN